MLYFLVPLQLSLCIINYISLSLLAHCSLDLPLLCVRQGSSKLQLLMEEWLVTRGDWKNSKLYEKMTVRKMERKHGARVWLTKQQLTKKYGCPQVAQQIVDAKMSDAELFESQTKPHPDAPQSEAGLECHWPCLPVFWGCSFIFHMQLVMCVRVCVCVADPWICFYIGLYPGKLPSIRRYNCIFSYPQIKKTLYWVYITYNTSKLSVFHEI